MPSVQDVTQSLRRARSTYPDQPGDSTVSLLADRVQVEPFNAIATAIFLAAIAHTFAVACYSWRVNALRELLGRDVRIAYALVFGSTARRTSHAASDLDVAVGLSAGVSLNERETGALVSDLEQAAGRPIDLVFLHEAPPALAYRIFRDGVTLLERDHQAFADRKARAVLEYLDFQPFEAIAVRGALDAAARGR